jgi:hypothetical protein
MWTRSGRPGAHCLPWIAAGVALAAACLHAEEGAKQPTAEQAKAEELRRAAYVQAMRTMATGLKVVRVTDEGETECKLVAEPVLNWSDSARHPDLLVPGTAWIWHHEGRPVFIGEIYGRTNSVGTWFLFGCSLSRDRVRFGDGLPGTTLTKSYYEPQEIADAPAVAEKKSERTFQMRRLADRFDAHQFWQERFELRLLPKPIYRYENADAGIVDGAVFALVHGTNPEVLLLIEAHKSTEGAPRWKVGFGSLAGARCVVRLDGKEFWTCPQHTGDRDDPRQGINGYFPAADPEQAAEQPQEGK